MEPEATNLIFNTYTDGSSEIHMSVTDPKTGIVVRGKGQSPFRLREKLIKELEIKTRGLCLCCKKYRCEFLEQAGEWLNALILRRKIMKLTKDQVDEDKQ